MFKPLCWFLIAFYCLNSCAPTQSNNQQRIVAMGDLHGDFDATQRALRLAGAMDHNQRWNGGDLTVVQTGDQLDRGDGELQILELFENLDKQAQKVGGKIHVLNGNHEIMNAQADLRYVTPKGLATFQHLPHLNLTNPRLKPLPVAARARAAAFLPGGPYALKLSQRSSILVLGDTLFVHGGVLPAHVDYGIDRINQEYREWLQGKRALLPPVLTNEQSPIWTRIYSDTQQPPDCGSLKQALQKIGLRRMVVGHTVQPTINAACEEQIWRIDVGMSKAYGGPIEVLEIVGNQVNVLKEKT